MKRYSSVWDTEHWTDGKDFDVLEEAKTCCMEVLEAWIEEFRIDHPSCDGLDKPSKLRDEWDNMINTCEAYVVEWVGKGEYKRIWEPSEAELEAIGWTLPKN